MKEQKIATSGFILRHDRTFLLVKRAENDDFLPGFWELPGGKLEFGEDVIIGAKREIKEETNLEVLIENPITIMTYIIEEPSKSEHHYVEILYLCTLNDPEQQVKLSQEHQDYKWITFDELPHDEISDLMRETLLKLKNHPLLHQ